MKLKYLLLCSALVMNAAVLCAQNSSSHAHATSMKWKGIDVLDVLAHPENYPGVEGDGIPVYLYNVGTGKFAIDGGDFGMEARLFFEDFGRQMKLRIMDGVLKIDPIITEAGGTTEDKYLFTLNIPGITKGNGWSDAFQYNFTNIMDGYYYWGKWNFQRIPSEDANSEFHTFYMYQQHNEDYGNSKAYTKIKAPRTYQGVNVKNIIFRFGAAYGEWCSDGTTTYGDGSLNKKGCGYYVNVDDDRSCWTTAGNSNNSEQSPWGNETMVEVNGDQVSIDELYQWRIISEEEFVTVLNHEVIGINPSVSSLVPDRDFTRNSNDFFTCWHINSYNSMVPEEGEGRYGYTWGEREKGEQQLKYNDEAWDSPVDLKKVFNTIKNAKFGFMSFEGVGDVSVSFEIPQPGWYQVEAYAIHFSNDPTHKAYMYGKTNWVTVTPELMEAANNSQLGYGLVELTRESDISAVKAKYPDYFSGITDANLNKSTQATNNAIGKILTFDGSDYCQKCWIYVSPTEFNASPENKQFTIGFIKDQATKTFGKTYDGINYYYDEDWICVDDIRMSYMGMAPAFFYEEEESLDYLVFDANYINERPSAQPDGMYSGALNLERKMKKNEWNSFAFPIPLTGEQVRLAFGEDCELLKMDQILNNEVGDPYWINFTTVDLKQEVTDPNNVPKVIEPGYFYLIKPTVDPVSGEDPYGRVTEFYQLGRNFFAVDPNKVPQDYAHTIIDTDHPYFSRAISSPDNTNDGISFVSYVRTPGGYDANGSKIFPIDTDGIYCGTVIDSDEYLYVPKGGYALTTKNNKQVFIEVNKDTPLKGFRAWLTLSKSLFTHDDHSHSTEIKVSVNGMDDNTNVTAIERIFNPQTTIADGTDVYDLSGRKVGTIGTTTLPSGIYIVAGKKVFVR